MRGGGGARLKREVELGLRVLEKKGDEGENCLIRREREERAEGE